MRWSNGKGWAAVLLTALTWVGIQSPPSQAAFISSDERIEASAKIEVQNTFHHKSIEKIDWVQFRNEFRFDLRYFFLGKFHGAEGEVGTQIYPINRARLSLLYRARYDGVFDIRDHYRELGYDRDDFRFPEGKIPRELFLDLDFQKPLDFLSLRIGRQQVVWGEADLFRSLDVINPLRLDQNGLIGEDFDEYREPLWIAKALMSLPELPFFANPAAEIFYSPNWRPLTDRAIVGEGFRKGVDRNFNPDCVTTLLPPPVGGCAGPLADAQGSGYSYANYLPFRQVRHPWEISRVGDFKTDAPDYADLGSDRTTCADLVFIPTLGLEAGCGDFLYLINNKVPTSTFDLDASMMGGRFMGQTFGGLDVSFNYIFKRTEVPGTRLQVDDLFDPTLLPNTGLLNARVDRLLTAVLAEATLDADGDGVPDGREQLINECIFQKQPRVILSALHGPNATNGESTPNLFTGCELVDFWYPWTHIMGFTATYNDFDYTGFIWRLEQSYSTKEPRQNRPFLANDRAGDFPRADDFERHLQRTTGAWRSMIGFDYLRAPFPHSALPRFLYHNKLTRSLLTDQWFFTFQFFNEYYTHVANQIGLLDSVTDRMQHHNPVLTFVMTGFFLQEKLRPFLAAGYDVNAEFPVTWLQFEYFFNRNLSTRLGWIGYLGSRNNESFLFLHKYADRDTLFARFTYYLI